MENADAEVSAGGLPTVSAKENRATLTIIAHPQRFAPPFSKPKEALPPDLRRFRNLFQ
jgi:hypothetical protein